MSVINFNSSVVNMSRNLRPYAINLTKDIDDAKDLLQETMFRALTNKDKYRQGTNLKAWLFTIMKNIFINGYRKKMKQKTIIDTTDNLFYINSSNNAIFNRSEGNFVLEDVLRAIKHLSKEYRIPFVMHYEGFKYQEIAEELKLPLGTVKSRIFFARKELKKQLSIYRFSNN